MKKNNGHLLIFLTGAHTDLPNFANHFANELQMTLITCWYWMVQIEAKKPDMEVKDVTSRHRVVLVACIF